MATQHSETQARKPKAPFILALDVGTSSTRTLLFDAQGTAIPSVHAQQQYKLNVTSEGEVSVDADELFKVVVQTIDDALKEAGALAEQISAVAIDTFWHGLLGVDERGKPLIPLITWEDTRAQSAALALRKELDEEAVHARTGARFHASYWPAKLRWLAQAQPDIFAQVHEWLSFGEYLHRQILGQSVCSLSMASATGLLNTRQKQWDEELMQALNVRPEQFPKLGDMRDGIKGLRDNYVHKWPALRDVPWYPALGDGAAACVGSGCASIENWSMTIGTSSAMRVVVRPERVVPPMSLWLYLIDANRAVLGGALSEGGNMLTWLDTVLKLPELKDAEPLVAALPPDEHGLTILPFISGERSLGWHAEARMTISGLHVQTTPAELLRAGMESLAYQLDGIYTQLCTTLQIEQGEMQPIIASGGALLSSKTLQQVIADTLGMPIYPSRDQEASARGAALLALEALGIIKDVAHVAPNLEQPTKPDVEKQSIYRKAEERQNKLYRLLLS